ncbi:uncharacterized protein LOC125657623 [Ostrea edulis]|uniref:uncharacterized protein LOC125657623 n=1 Tax=Ostrea edulis TaxID=37623 RepID=UPI0020964CA6|nr:uncharacterized protein LOC125657623 [Ostrea edulis]
MEEQKTMPKVKQELLPLPDLSRRRSHSDAAQYRQARRNSTKSTIPDIKITNDDSSDISLDEIEDEFDFELTFPMRPRANTCPNDLFQRPKSSRPPTPPPIEGKKLTWKELTQSPRHEKVTFAKHKLTKVSEVTEDKAKPEVVLTITEMSSCASEDAKVNSSISPTISRTIGLSEIG